MRKRTPEPLRWREDGPALPGDETSWRAFDPVLRIRFAIFKRRQIRRRKAVTIWDYDAVAMLPDGSFASFDVQREFEETVAAIDKWRESKSYQSKLKPNAGKDNRNRV